MAGRFANKGGSVARPGPRLSDTARDADATASRGQSTLVNRNVFVGRHRTSVRLEPAMWDALAEICQREDITLHELCELIDARRKASSLTAAIRVFALSYYRAAATEAGHAGSGHGMLHAARRRARRGVPDDEPVKAAVFNRGGPR